jgi:hypothetical protein
VALDRVDTQVQFGGDLRIACGGGKRVSAQERAHQGNQHAPLVAFNNSTAPITFAVASGGAYFSYAIPAGAMTRFVWR